jgi:hypothetical protein
MIVPRTSVPMKGKRNQVVLYALEPSAQPVTPLVQP